MSRWFFDQVDDELRGLVGPALRNFQTQKNGRLLKLWYGDPSVHFEAQKLVPPWSPSVQPCIEVGLHLETKEASRNQSLLDGILERRELWSNTLPEAEHGECFGPRGAAWRRLSEIIEIDELNEDLAGEVAERFACYILTLRQLLGTALLRP